jgi:hypothetical protein
LFYRPAIFIQAIETMNSPLTIIHQNCLNHSFANEPSVPFFAINDFSQRSLKSLSLESEWIAFFPDHVLNQGGIQFQSPEDFIPKDCQAAIIPFNKSGRSLQELDIIPTNLAVLIANPLWLGIPVIHQSKLNEALKTESQDTIWNAFAQEAFHLKKIGILKHPVEINIQNQQPMPSLAPGTPSEELEWLRFQIMNRPTGKLISQPDISLETIAVRAGLLQFHDELDASHQCSQNREGEQLADHWHGIMHRREPDDSNAKYWYRRVGKSLIFKNLSKHAESVLSNISSSDADVWRKKLISSSGWDSFAFIDFCSFCRKSNDKDLIQAAENIQYMEMLLLLSESC